MTKRIAEFLLAANFLLFMGYAAPSRVPEPRIPFGPEKYVCYRAPTPVVIDGDVDEAAWSKTSWSGNFVDIEGSARIKPRLRTMVKMLWDDDYFYVGAFLEEPNVWATLTEPDSLIYMDNDFEVFIDPDGDTHNYYELEINALSTVWDLFLAKPYRDGGPAIHAWAIKGLKTAVKIVGTLNDPGTKDKSWFVEIAIPWEVLKEAASPKSAPKDGDQWRINFSRVEYRLNVEGGQYVKAKDAAGRTLPEENWVWSPTGLVNIHYPEMWGYVQFSGKTAGQGRDTFQEKAEEKVKWALRKIYYAEWAHKAEKSTFANDWQALGLKERDIRTKGYAFPPIIQSTENLFEAAYQGQAGEIWRIRDDGKVWKDQ